MPLSCAASSRDSPSRTSAIASRRHTTRPSRVLAASARDSAAELSSRMISIGLPICTASCCEIEASQNRTPGEFGNLEASVRSRGVTQIANLIVLWLLWLCDSIR